jgi:hypothetical protein
MVEIVFFWQRSKIDDCVSRDMLVALPCGTEIWDLTTKLGKKNLFE